MAPESPSNTAGNETISPKAVRATEEILTEFATDVAEWTLIPSSGGVFEVMVNDQLVFSKRALKRHAKPGELYPLVSEALAG